MWMSRIIVVMLGLNIVLTSGGLFLSYTLIQTGSGEGGGLTAIFSKKASAQEEKKEYAFFPIEKIIVSLADSGREHYFVIDLVLQAERDVEVEALKQIDPMVRNSVVSRLSALKFTELRTMSIGEVQTTLDEALREDFDRKNIAVPFVSVLVSKLLVQ